MQKNQLVAQLNAPLRAQRLDALRQLKALTNSGDLPAPVMTQYVNNHIHTTYSFSPYSPAMAVYMAWQNGLPTAGIMDHDSVSGAYEFIEAGEIAGIATTVGIECRVDVSRTPLGMRRINNTDQSGVAYTALHGIPHQNIEMVNGYFAPFRCNRNIRNHAMCERISELVKPSGLSLSFEEDVLPLSMHHEGGGVTERHILYALTKKITALCTTPDEVIEFLSAKLGMCVSDKIKAMLRTAPAEYYEYDILGALKAELVEKFYIDATDECPDVRDFIKLAKASQGIATYPYLGDVGDSVTGDKKTQKFEDDYLDFLFDIIGEIGYKAIAFMPTRNTQVQLERVMALSDKCGFFQISGEDINSPRQGFICKSLDNPAFAHLIRAAWALIGHEMAATEDLCDSFVSDETAGRYHGLAERIEHFYEIGKAL